MRSKEILKELGIKQSFLVKELIGNPISSFYGNNIDIREKEKQSDVIRVQLSSAINNNRIPSENLLENIKKVLLSKFKDKEDIEKIVSEFELSLKDTSKKIAYKKPKPVEQVVEIKKVDTVSIAQKVKPVVVKPTPIVVKSTPIIKDTAKTVVESLDTVK